MPAGECAFTGVKWVETGQKSSLFSFSSCALLALLTAILSPYSTALPSERGHGEVHFALFKNVITIIIIMIVLMMIIAVVKIKGGVCEGAGSSRGEATSV